MIRQQGFWNAGSFFTWLKLSTYLNKISRIFRLWGVGMQGWNRDPNIWKDQRGGYSSLCSRTIREGCDDCLDAWIGRWGMRDGAPYFPLFLDSFDRYTPGSLYPACAIAFPPFSCIVQNPDWTWFDGMVHWNISRIHVHHTVIRFLDLTVFGFCFEDFDLVAASRISYKMGVFCITRPKIPL